MRGAALLVTLEDATSVADIFVTATGNYHVITHDQRKAYVLPKPEHYRC